LASGVRPLVQDVHHLDGLGPESVVEHMVLDGNAQRVGPEIAPFPPHLRVIPQHLHRLVEGSLVGVQQGPASTIWRMRVSAWG
jgi:hypothetical protein